MINQGRTLLANQQAANGDFTAHVAEEYTPEDFRPLELPDHVNRLRAVLFGISPDRDMTNYRCRQLLSIVHRTPYAEYLHSLDGRLTYRIGDAVELVPGGRFSVTVTQVSGGSPTELPVIGHPQAPDPIGKVRLRYQVSVLTTTSVRVLRTTPPVGTQTEAFVLTDGLSDMLPLTGSGYNFRLTDNATDLSWVVEVLNRPQYDVGALVAAIAARHKGDVLRLLAGPAPYTTFRNLWEQKELPGRVAGLVLGLIYRADEVWRAAHAVG